MNLSNLKIYFRLVVVLLLFTVYSLALVYAGVRFAERNAESGETSALHDDEGGIKKPLPAENVQSATVLAGNVKLCANTEYSFEISYPSNWYSSYNNKKDECFHFAPYSFVLPALPDDYFTPVTIKLIPPEEWESTLNSFKNPSDLYNIITFQNREVNGRPVKFIETTSTGNSQSKGFFKITYLIYDAKKPVELTYFQQSENDDVSDYRTVLEEMVNSLKYY